MREFRYPLTGEVDLATAPKIREDLELIVSATDGHVLIDCTDLAFIDSTGVSALVQTRSELRSLGRDLVLANVGSRPRRVFDMLGLTDMLRGADARTSTISNED
jgi:anti-sigma B factor antagonist